MRLRRPAVRTARSAPFAAFAFVAVSLTLTSAAHATMVLPLDLSALTDVAEQVAVVRVESQVARFTDDYNYIFTEATMRVVEPLKGSLRAGDAVQVRREGGEAEGMGVKVVGAPQFVVGEEAVVFLERRGTDAYWTVGMAQGRLRIGTVDGKKMVVRNFAGLAFTTNVAPNEPRVQPLDEVRSRIIERAAQTPGKAPNKDANGGTHQSTGDGK